MSFANVGTFACREINQKLIDYFGANTAESKTMGSKSLVRWLLGAQNTRGFRQITDAITGLPSAVLGKLRAVAFSLDEPLCFDVCSIDGLDCNTARGNMTPLTKEVVFDFDNTAPYLVCDDEGQPLRARFTRAELAKYCTEDDTDYITRQINRINKRYIEAVDKRLGQLLATMVGTNADGDSVTQIPFFLDHASGLQTLNPQARWYLDKIYSDIGGENQYALIGGAVLTKLIQYSKWAGLTDAGIDLAEVLDVDPYAFYDRFLDATIGQNNFFMLSPGAVQLVTWNEYLGDYNREVTDLYTNGTVVDPETGLELDFEWRYDYNCHIWTYEPRLHLELAVARPGGCGLPTSNGVLLIEDCTAGATPPVCPDQS